MAMIDYGSIAFKNGKLISTGMFTPMKEMVGWEDTDEDVHYNYYKDAYEPLRLNGNYFAYVGDEEYTLGFYKTWMCMVEKCDGKFYKKVEDFGDSYFTWSKWKKWFGDAFDYIKVTKRNGYLVCKWKYKGDKYKVYFGYGVDLPYYKKWHIVNYYRSPKYRLIKLRRWIKDKIFDWKYCR